MPKYKGKRETSRVSKYYDKVIDKSAVCQIIVFVKVLKNTKCSHLVNSLTDVFYFCGSGTVSEGAESVSCRGETSSDESFFLFLR